MVTFFSIFFGIILFIAAILTFPLAQHLKDKSGENNMAHFWRWRVLSALCLLLGISLAALGFYLIAQIIS